MGNKKISDFGVMAESHIPSDLLTPSLGSNYGLDGYPDMQYGMGVLEGVLDQDLQEPPALPDGVQRAGAEDMDLGGMIAEQGLSDLGWLDPSQLQDPGRLPETPDSIPELEQAWGMDRLTDGVHVSSHQIDPDYARSNNQTPKVKASSRTIEKVVTHAMRRSIEGQSIRRILREAAESMGEDMERVVPLLRRVAEDHGLSGKVFVRVSAYPGWGTGKWKDHAKKYAKQAQYIVVSKKELNSAVWIQDGVCIYTGKKAVVEVPWDKAHKYYAPRLEAVGRKVASGDKREALKKAFLYQPKQTEGDAGFLPTHKTPDQRVSKTEAREALASAKSDRKVYDPSDRLMASRMEKVSRHLARMERDHLIPAGVRNSILSSGKSPESMLREASAIASRVKVESYQGDERVTEAQSLRMENEHARVAEKQKRSKEALEGYDKTKCARTLNNWIESGAVKKSHVRKLLGIHKDIRIVVGELLETIAETQVSKSGNKSDLEFANGYNSSVSVNAAEVKPHVTKQSIMEELENSIRKSEALESKLSREATMRSHSLTRAAKSEREVTQLVAKVKREIERGARGSYLRDFISRTIPKEHLKAAGEMLSPILTKSGALKDTTREARVYSQPVYKAGMVEKKSRSVLAGEVQQAVKWVRRVMTEGFAGKKLDALISNRFSEAMLKSAGEEISQIRSAHEGVSGFLYIDSESYASDSGVKGCEAGALKHRANQIPGVLAMKRCSTCTLVRKTEDGTLKCGNYNKPLLSPKDVSGDEINRVKSANITNSNMSDAEVTSSLFAPKYNPSEFGLSNDNLEGIDSHIPESEKVAEIMFGGWNI